MDSKQKKPWTKPVLRQLEPTSELLKLFADHAKDSATSAATFMK